MKITIDTRDWDDTPENNQFLLKLFRNFIPLATEELWDLPYEGGPREIQFYWNPDPEAVTAMYDGEFMEIYGLDLRDFTGWWVKDNYTDSMTHPVDSPIFRYYFNGKESIIVSDEPSKVPPLPEEWYEVLANIVGPELFEEGHAIHDHISKTAADRPDLPLGLLYQLMLLEASSMLAYHFEHADDRQMYGPVYLETLAERLKARADLVRFNDTIGPNGMN